MSTYCLVSFGVFATVGLVFAIFLPSAIVNGQGNDAVATAHAPSNDVNAIDQGLLALVLTSTPLMFHSLSE